ncbi:hypothetical protein ACU8V7_19425 [Zobellia nedashkovskayae]
MDFLASLRKWISRVPNPYVNGLVTEKKTQKNAKFRAYSDETTAANNA